LFFNNFKKEVRKIKKFLLFLVILIVATTSPSLVEREIIVTKRAATHDVFVYGQASWYGPGFFGKTRADGKKYLRKEVFAAHKSLPFGSRLLVKNLINQKTIEVRIKDRGPFVEGRILDLSFAAAKMLDMIKTGVIPVQYKILHVCPPRKLKAFGGHKRKKEEKKNKAR